MHANPANSAVPAEPLAHTPPQKEAHPADPAPPIAPGGTRCQATTDRGTPCRGPALPKPDPDGARRCLAHSRDPESRKKMKENGKRGRVAAALRERKQRELNDLAIDVGEAPIIPPPPKRKDIDIQTADGWREQVARVVQDVIHGSINPGQASAALAGMRLLLDERSKAPEETDDRLDALLERLK